MDDTPIYWETLVDHPATMCYNRNTPDEPAPPEGQTECHD